MKVVLELSTTSSLNVLKSLTELPCDVREGDGGCLVAYQRKLSVISPKDVLQPRTFRIRNQGDVPRRTYRTARETLSTLNNIYLQCFVNVSLDAEHYVPYYVNEGRFKVRYRSE